MAEEEEDEEAVEEDEEVEDSQPAFAGLCVVGLCTLNQVDP
jgi:hypothetical protein